MTQLEQERFPAIQISDTIPLPAPPDTPEQAVEYIRKLHSFLSDQQVELGNVVRELTYHRTAIATDDDDGTGSGTSGATTSQPDAAGSNVTSPMVNRDTGQGRIFVDILDKAGDPLWYEIGGGATGEITGDPNGFEDRTTSTLSFSDITRTFAIEPVSDSFFYWNHGVRQKGLSKSIMIPSTTGLHHFYIDDTETLVTAMTVTVEELIRDNVYCGNVYWDALRNKSVIRGDERHGLMPWQAHLWMHEYLKTQYGYGLTLGDILADQDGSLDAHCEFSNSSGRFADEDITFDAPSRRSSEAITTISKEGGTGTWYIESTGTAPIVMSLGVPQINMWSGTAWVQQAVPNNYYYLAHIYAVNEWQDGGYIAIQGEASYLNLADARDGAVNEIADLTTQGMPMAEFLPLGTIIFQYKTTYSNTFASRIRTTESGDDYVSWLGTTLSQGSPPSAHANLTGRDSPSQHPDDAVDLSIAHSELLSGDATVADAMVSVDTIPSNGLGLNNGVGFSGKDTLGTFRNLAKVDTQCRLGDPGLMLRFDSNGTVYFPSTSFQLENSRWISFKNGSGSYKTFLGAVNSIFYLGHPDMDLNVRSSGEIEFNANDLKTTGDVFAGNVGASTVEVSEVLRNTNTMDMVNNVAVNPFRWWPTADGDFCSFTLGVALQVEYTLSAVTYWYLFTQVMHGHMLRTGSGANLVLMSNAKDTAQETNSGSAVISTAFNMSPTGTATNGAGPYISSNLSSGGTFVSSEMTYHLEILDKNSRALTQL